MSPADPNNSGQISKGQGDKSYEEPNLDVEGREEEESEDGDDEDGSEKDEKKISGFVSSKRPKDEPLESKRMRKKAVQMAKAEKRQQKIPKHVKKRATKCK